MSDRLLEALDELVPVPDERGDWDAVVERTREANPRSRRPLLVLAGMAAIAVALIATPAFGIGSALLDLIGRTNVDFSQTAPAPNVIKKRFADMGRHGAPSGMAPEAIATETREVGQFTFQGRKRALWVAPTKGGGYCYVYEHASGGCRKTAADRARFPLAMSWEGRGDRTGKSWLASGAGQVSSPNVATIELRYSDGDSVEIPFVWVSKPIAAGFFVFAIPRDKTPSTVVALDANGNEIASEAPPVPRLRPPLSRPLPPKPSPPVVLPSVPAVAPSEPIQRGTADGVSVVAGRNGSIVFDLSNGMARLANIGKQVSYNCFRITQEFGIFGMDSASRGGALRPRVAYHGSGTRGPFDGCELSGLYGHTWPDRFDSHNAAEIPLTAAGGAFFANRAAARDLAAFVRLRRVQQLRKEPPAQALRDLRAAYPELARSSIHIEQTATGLTFSETSPTGRVFTVVVSQGRIARQNLKPYAFVF